MRKKNQYAVPSTGHSCFGEFDNQIKVDLIRRFQRLEGNIDCCASPYVRVCKQDRCLWRDDCHAMIRD